MGKTAANAAAGMISNFTGTRSRLGQRRLRSYDILSQAEHQTKRRSYSTSGGDWGVRASLAEQLRRAHRKLGPVVDAELVEDGVKIDLHGSFGDPELRGDVAVPEALADEVDQLAFARSQCRSPLGAFLHGAGPLGDLGIDPALASMHLL